MIYYQSKRLLIEQCAISEIAERYGTPIHCISQHVINLNHYEIDQALQGIPHQICYAMKANPSLAVLKILANRDSGVDIVSEGEMRFALAAKIPASKMVFSGVGKTPQELTFALKNKIGLINVESEQELESLSSIAESLGILAPTAIRINPDVGTQGHQKLSTGQASSKFGIPLEKAEEYLSEG